MADSSASQTKLNTLLSHPDEPNRLVHFVTNNPLPSLAVGLGVIFLTLSGVLYWRYIELDQEKLVIVKASEASSSAELMVDISGAVTSPGLYKLPVDARVNDLVKEADGLLDEADTTWVQQSLNLAARLRDGQKFYVPYEGEAGQETQQVLSGFTSSEGEYSHVNLNSASVAELDTLSGIGPMTAQKIVEYREKIGQFASLEDLPAIPGIGEKTVEKIRSEVAVE